MASRVAWVAVALVPLLPVTVSAAGEPEPKGGPPPRLEVSQSGALAVDADGSGDVSPGDLLSYVVTVKNVGARAAEDVVFEGAPGRGSALRVGSVATHPGAVVSGNAGGDGVVTVVLGLLRRGTAATVTYEVTVDSPLPPGLDRILNQGVVVAERLPAVLTDDPATPQAADPTAIVVGARPALEAVKAARGKDEDEEGKARPGEAEEDGEDEEERLLYDVTVSNAGTAPATGVVFTDAPGEHLELVPGSVSTSRGTVVSGNADGDAAVAVEAGEVAAGEAVAIRFEAQVDQPLPGAVAALANQGRVTSAEDPAGRPTDDPATLAVDDPTLSARAGRALLEAAKVDSLLADADGDGRAGPGDVLRYVVVISNRGRKQAKDVVFTDTPGLHTTLVEGTVATSAGEVLSGNAPGDRTVAVDIGHLKKGDAATVTFAVAVETPLAGVASVANQGRVTAEELEMPTDDPATPAADDPTVTDFSATLGDFVWDDANRDGVQDPGEPGVADVAVTLLDGAGNAVAETRTGADGRYLFDRLSPGSYAVVFSAPEGSGFSPADRGDDASDSDADPASGRTPAVTLGPGAVDLDLDAGLIAAATASVAGRGFHDLDADGVQDPGEPGVAGAAVTLLDADGEAVASAVTEADGSYRFDELDAGGYAVAFAAPAGFSFSPADRGGDESADSDVDPATGRTAVLIVAAGEEAVFDAGLFRFAELGDLVWSDLDGDGVRDAGEPGLAEVPVSLLDAAGRQAAGTVTDGGGRYAFPHVVPGDYLVEFSLPRGAAFSPRDQGTDDERDSDADPATGRTPSVTLLSGESRSDLDAGFFRPLTTLATSPENGERDVALTRETVVRFSSPLDPGAVIHAGNLFAEFGGARLDGRIHLAPDRQTVTLFYDRPLPASARVRVTLIGDSLRNLFGNAVDADGDGSPGGTAAIDFDTLALTTLPDTRVCGRVFASELAPGGGGTALNVPLEGVKVTVDGMEDTLRTATDSLGNFCLDPAPAGRFFVHVDGRTAANGVPPGAYYPFVGKAWDSVPGQTVNVGEIFLPLVPAGTLQPVSATEATTITFAPSVLAQFPQLEGTEIVVPADSLYADDGTRGGAAGIAPVPSDRLPGRLPPGLGFPIVITLQTDGPTNFDRPVPVCFPNLPDPVSGAVLPAGGESALWSFNHDTGAFEIVGPMTVAEDGRLVCTDPGVGIRAPGWHGSQPGVGGSSDPPAEPPPPPDCDEINKTLGNEYLEKGLPAGVSGVPAWAAAMTPADKRGTAAAALAHQISCLAQRSCRDDDPTFIKKVLEDLTNDVKNPDLSNPADTVCTHIPPWLPTGRIVLPSAGDLCAVAGGFGYHFPELYLSFLSHCPLDEAAHERFFNDAVIPCFDEVRAAGELTLIPTLIAKRLVPLTAGHLRDHVNAVCSGSRLQGPASPAVPFLKGFPALPAPLSRDQIFQPEYETISTLEVTAAGGEFFLPVGADVQLRVIRRNPDGSTTDLTSASTGTRYFAAVGDGGVTISPDGLLSVLATPSPLPTVTPAFVVFAGNGDDLGIGQFAVLDVDSDGDLVVDSFERKIGRDPRASDDIGSDLDGDGLRDIEEVLFGTDPRRADSDADGIADATELECRLDPLALSTQLLAPRREQFFYSITHLGSGAVLRGSTSHQGTLSNLVLGANSSYRASFFHAGSGLVAGGGFSTPRSGSRIKLPPAVLKVSSAPDSDGDGLRDDAEEILGTRIDTADSDGDGISDRAEIDQGTDPLDGLPGRTGILATADTPGTAIDVCAVNDVAVVADSEAGVTVFNVFNGMNPIAVAQIDTPGVARAVACAGRLIAVADDQAGLAVVDVGDPPAAFIAHQVGLGAAARAVTVAGEVAYLGLSSGVVAAVDMASGTILSETAVGGAVQDVLVAGDTLYALTVGTVHALPLRGDPAVAGSASSPGSVGAGLRRLRLFAGGGILYATHTSGYNTFSLADPDHPALIKAGTSPQRGWKQIVANGSGLGVAAVSPNSTSDGPHHVSLYDLSDPAVTDAFLTEFATPGLAAAVSIFNGLAYVADSLAGLQVVNYLPYDALGVAPTLSVSTNFAPGVAEEGQQLRVTADVGDDVQVKNVEFFVDGARALSDGNFPFEHRFVTPLLADRPSFVVAACATDTGGNRTCSGDLTIHLTADATAPRVVAVTPANGAGVAQGTMSTVSATFSEPVDPATLDGASFRLFAAGPDELAGTADDVEVDAALTFREAVDTAFLTAAAPLPPDLYRGVVSGSVSDLAGNPLPGDFTWTFRVRGPAQWINPAGGDWNDPANWSTGAVPSAGDLVRITLPGAYAVTFSGNATVASVVVGGGGAGPTLWIRGSSSGGHTVLAVTGDVTNHGTLRLESQSSSFSSQLSVDGTLVNLGTVEVNQGSFGTRVIAAARLLNAGTLDVNYPLSLARTTGVYVNEGVVDVADGQKLTVTGLSQVVHMNGGDLAGTGVLELRDARLAVNAGTFSGAPPLLVNSTLEVSPAADAPATFRVTGSGSRVRGTTSAGQLVWVQGSSVGSHTTVDVAGFANGGTLRLESVNSSFESSVTGGFTNRLGGVVEVNQGPSGSRRITGDFRNDGTLDVHFGLAGAGTWTNTGTVDVDAGQKLTMNGAAQTFNHDGGDLTGAGSIELSGGSTFNHNGGTTSGANPPLVIQSALRLAASEPATFMVTGSSSTVSGTVAPGQTLWVSGQSAGSHTLVSLADGFVNAGLLRLESRNSSFESSVTGNFTNRPGGVVEVNQGPSGQRRILGDFRNEGILDVNFSLGGAGVWTNTGTVDVAAGQKFSMSGSAQVFRHGGGDLAGEGAIEFVSGVTVRHDGGTTSVANPPLLINSALELAASDPAIFMVTGSSSTVSGTVAAGQTLWVSGQSAGGHTLVHLADGFVNAGTLRLESRNSSFESSVAGNFTNRPGGVIEVNQGPFGPRRILGDFRNEGDLEVNFSLVGAGVWTNTGTVDVAAAQKLTMNGAAQVWNHDGGTIAGPGQLELSTGATLSFNGGGTSGSPPVLISSSLRFGPDASEAATFVLAGTSNLSGDVGPGQTVWVSGRSAGGHAGVTAASGFTNAGTLRLESQNSSFSSNLSVTSGVLVNTGVIEVNTGSFGQRLLTAALDNRGALLANESMTLGKPGAGLSNTGRMSIAAGKTLTVTGASLTNGAGGEIEGRGTLNVGAVPFSNGGAIRPGTSAGILTVSGGLAQTAAGAVAVELGGTAAGGQYDRLSISGLAALDGTLAVTLIDGFSPSPGQSFLVLSYGSRAGAFAAVDGLDLGNGLRLDPSYGTTGLTLTVVSAP